MLLLLLQWHHAVALPQQTQEATDPEAGLEQGAVEAPTAHQGDVRHQRVTDQVGQVQAQARRVRQLAAQLRAPGFAAGQDDRARAAAQVWATQLADQLIFSAFVQPGAALWIDVWPAVCKQVPEHNVCADLRVEIGDIVLGFAYMLLAWSYLC